MEENPTSIDPIGRAESAGRLWLLRLRLLCTGGAFALVAGLSLWGDVGEHRMSVLLLIGGWLATNLALRLGLDSGRWLAPPLLAAVFVFDVLVLTAVLGLTGGSANPFASAYSIPVTVAALVLPLRWTWVVVASAVVAYGVLVWPGEVPMHHGHQDMRLHVVGMWAAFLVVAPMVAYAVTRLRNAVAEAEEELARARGRQAQSEKLAALATLSAGAAHELSTPLGTIAIAARELERRSQDEEILEDARLIREEIDRCSAILSQLAADVGAGMGEATRSTRIGDLIDDAIGDRGRVEVHGRPDLLERRIRIPARQLGRALHGLVENARQASGDAQIVRVAVRDGGEELLVEIRDEGSGMSEEVQQRAGEPFFTTKPTGRGMGLGLFFARSVIEHVGGRLVIDSAPGAGTCVSVGLPWDDRS